MKTKQRFLFTLLMAIVMMAMSPTRVWAYDEPQSETIEGKTWYKIATASELLWFMQMEAINTYPFTEYYAKLTADIVINENVLNADGTLNTTNGTPSVTWKIPNYFAGVLDGDGHTISGIYCKDDGNNHALVEDNRGTIKNLGIIDSYIGKSWNSATFAMSNHGTITDCYSYATLGTANNISGGIVAWNYQYVTNCYFAGKMTTNISNSSPIIASNETSYKERYKNNYYLSTTLLSNMNTAVGTSVSATDITSGRLAMLLQAGRTTAVWGQNITTTPYDAHPVIYGPAVYADKISCNGTAASDAQFSNTEYAGVTTANHDMQVSTHHNATCSKGSYDTYTCTVCGHSEDGAEANDKAHSLNHTTQQDATCTAKGWHEYWKCSYCSKYFKDADCTETYTDDTNETTGVWIAMTEHSYSSSLDSDGLKTCSVCGNHVGEEPTKVSDESSSFNGYYAISKPAHLLWFRDFVNTKVEVEGNTTYPNTGAKAYLVDNISMSALCHPADATNGTAKVNWTPIGLKEAFTGIFDGNNKTISNLYINDPDEDYKALFEWAAEDAEIKNLTVKGNVTAEDYVALILAYAEDCVKLTNCKSEGAVTGSDNYIAGIVAYFDGDEDNIPTIAECKNSATITSTDDGDAYAGGIVGYAEDVYISKCTNEATVTADGYYVGGIVGYIEADDTSKPSSISECKNTGAVSSTYSSNAYAGGIVGAADDVNISKCKNEATVTADGYYVGGILGYTDPSDPSSISECTNTGAISSTYKGSTYVGGIVGEAYDVYISKCKNEATVTADGYYVGGIIGYLSTDDPSKPSSISECTNTGTATITTTYNGDAYVGGIVGYAYDVNLSKCTNEADVTADGYDVGGIVGDADNAFSVSACKNTGDITSNYDNGGCYAGGIIGCFDCSSVLEMSQCYNTGKISATGNDDENSYIGGLAGYLYASASGSYIKDCYTTGDVVSNRSYKYAYVGGAFGELSCPTVSNVYSAATITKNAAATDYVGAFAGYLNYSTLTNCHYDSNKTSLNFNGYEDGNTIDASVNGGKSTAAFASGEVAYLLNGKRSEGTTESPLVWYQAIGRDAYPTFDINEYTIVKYDATDGYYNDMENFASIEIQDGTAYEAKLNRTADQLTYKRNFANTTYNALYVPFAMSYNDWSDKADIYRLLVVVEKDNNDDGNIDEWVLKVVKLKDGESTKANTPYVIKPKETGEMELTLSNVTLAAAQEKSIWCASTDYKFVFTGSYAEKAIAADSYFFMSTTGALQYGDSDKTLKPQRWYMGIYDKDTDDLVTPSTFNPSAAPAKAISIICDDEDEATGINETLRYENVNENVYNLSGQRLTTPQKGINIINGKKILVK